MSNQQYTPSLIASLGELHTLEYKGKGMFAFGFNNLTEQGLALREANVDKEWVGLADDEDEIEFTLLLVRPSFPLDAADKESEIATMKDIINNYGCYVYTVEGLRDGVPAPLFRDLEDAYEDYPAIWYVPCGETLLTIWGDHSEARVSETIAVKRNETIQAIQKGRNLFFSDNIRGGRNFNTSERRLTLAEGCSFQLKPAADYHEFVLRDAKGNDHVYLDMLNLFIDYPAIRAGEETREEKFMRELQSN